MLTIRIIPKMSESPPARRKRSAPYEMPLNACVTQNSMAPFRLPLTACSCQLAHASHSIRKVLGLLELRNEQPRNKLTAYQKIAMRIYPKGVTLECFNRGSTALAWIPDRSIRE